MRKGHKSLRKELALEMGTKHTVYSVLEYKKGKGFALGMLPIVIKIHFIVIISVAEF